jgi:hypothetical protein
MPCNIALQLGHRIIWTSSLESLLSRKLCHKYEGEMTLFLAGRPFFVVVGHRLLKINIQD